MPSAVVGTRWSFCQATTPKYQRPGNPGAMPAHWDDVNGSVPGILSRQEDYGGALESGFNTRTQNPIAVQLRVPGSAG
jgi:hypothetical protein